MLLKKRGGGVGARTSLSTAGRKMEMQAADSIMTFNHNEKFERGGSLNWGVFGVSPPPPCVIISRPNV